MKKKNRNDKIYLKAMFYIGTIGLIIFMINQFFFQICFVYGSSMEPTLKDKDMILLNKMDRNFHPNDIVVIEKNGNIIIKRIIGIPMDSIKIDEYVYVNGEKFDHLYIKDPKENSNIELKENEFYVLGDNRDQSIDSRDQEIGVIKKEEIIGKMMQ